MAWLAARREAKQKGFEDARHLQRGGFHDYARSLAACAIPHRRHVLLHRVGE
jgi:hypothetical protein